jgi:hypothetical protein
MCSMEVVIPDTVRCGIELFAEFGETVLLFVAVLYTITLPPPDPQPCASVRAGLSDAPGARACSYMCILI